MTGEETSSKQSAEGAKGSEVWKKEQSDVTSTRLVVP